MIDPAVSVVVPCRNEESHIGRLLAAVAGQSVAPGDIVIIDGGSTDGTHAAIAAAAERIRPITVKTIVAPEDRLPAAINRGVREAAGRAIVRLDGHSSPSPDYIERAVTHLSDPRVGVVGGVWQITPGGASALAAGIARAVAHPLGAGDAAYRIQSARLVTDMDTVPFGCFMRQTWEQVGGLNEGLLGNEDYEFNYRVRCAGLSVRLDPMMHSTYVSRPGFPALALQYFRYGWCKMQMLSLHPSSLRWRQTVPVLFVLALIVLTLLAPFVSGTAALLGAMTATYLAVLGSAAAKVCAREGGWARVLPMVLAFATIHLCWGTGALVFVATGGRWPDRRFLFGLRAVS